MSLTKNLVVTITNEAEGISLTVKTLGMLSGNPVLIAGDPGVYDIGELKRALALCEEFQAETQFLKSITESRPVPANPENFEDYIGAP